MQLIRRFRIPALFCALCVLLCALLRRPYAEMGISDDGPYILMARHLADTGHIAYNGWGAPMLGWQLYLGAAFIKLFGFSFTSVRMSTLLVAAVTAWLMQRTLVLAGINERYATLGTLAFVLSPLYLLLSVTYMTDITGLFGVAICFYGCLRALQASTEGATIFWLCFAVTTNAIFGTSRQIAWLGILVMVPSTLWLLRFRRSILWAGSAATSAGVLFIFGCMEWLKQQPYTIPEHLIIHRGDKFNSLASFFPAALEAPFLLLPIAILFLPELGRDRRRTLKAALAALSACILALLALRLIHAHAIPLLEPYMGDWVTKYGGYGSSYLPGAAPTFLHTAMRLLLTIASLGGFLGLIASLLHPRQACSCSGGSRNLPWRGLVLLVTPFAVAYTLLLLPRASNAGIYDRYLLVLLLIALPCLLRHYQERALPRLSAVGAMTVCIMAGYGIVTVRDMFSFYRARVALAAEVRAAGVPDASASYGWEYDYVTALRHSDHLNGPGVRMPPKTEAPKSLPRAGSPMGSHLAAQSHPLYGVSFDPNALGGPAPFAPVHYSRWPYRTPGTLYVVRYLPPKT